MAANSVPDLVLAKILAAPYMDRRSQENPLSCRFTPEGELVVIAADGRKLWFSAVEVSRARKELKAHAQRSEKAESAAHKRGPVRLAPLPPEALHMNNGAGNDEQEAKT